MSAVRYSVRQRCVVIERELVEETGGPDAAQVLELFFEHAPAHVWTTDAELRFTFASGLSHRALGHHREEFVGMHAEEYFGPSPAGRRMADALAAALTGQPQECELGWDGQWFHVFADAMRDETGAIVGTIGIAVDLTEKHAAEEALARAAMTDDLTGIPNRRAFFKAAELALQEAVKQCGSFALVLIDIDQFSVVNDTFGHLAGNQVLQQFATRLYAAARGAFVARSGGDEFLAFFTDVNGDDIVARVEALLEGLAMHYVIEGSTVCITASAGTAVFPSDGAALSDLLRLADGAMYRAKAAGGRVVAASPLVDSQQLHRLRLNADLHEALARGELEVWFQPYSSGPREVFAGAEALVRWRHPTFGLLAAAEFIGIAESSGAVVPIGRFVLDSALRWSAASRGPRGHPIRVSVNVSPREFTEAHFERTVEKLLEHHGLEGSALEIEITESLLLHHGPHVVRTLTALRAMGVSIAVDDFGTGYNSMAYLKHFPVTTLKIDHLFVAEVVSDEFSRAIVAAICTLGRTLGLNVIAECVETADQLEALREIGCRLFQGYLICEPRPAQALAADVSFIPPGVNGRRAAPRRAVSSGRRT